MKHRRRLSHRNRPNYNPESLEPRTLLANSIQFSNNTFTFNVGQQVTVIGRVVDSLGQPVSGASVSADDAITQSIHSLGTTTPNGYFSIVYTSSQTSLAGPGLFAVGLDAGNGAKTGIVLNLQPPNDPSYVVPNVVINYGSGQSASGIFGWVTKEARSVLHKTQTLLDVDLSGRLTSDDYLAIGKEFLPSLSKWSTDYLHDFFTDPGNQIAIGALVTGVGTAPALEYLADNAIGQVYTTSANSIIDSLESIGLISATTAMSARGVVTANSVYRTVTGLSPVAGLVPTALEMSDLISATTDTLKSYLELERDAFSNVVGVNMVRATQTNGVATGAVLYSYHIPTAVSTAPTPTITYVTPNLSGLPVPQKQMLVVRGSGFLTNSLLEFNDGTTTYRNRIPTYVTKGTGGQPDEIGYNITVGNDTANWTVKVLNGSKVSASASFSVTAQADDGAPAAPIGLTSQYIGGVGANLFFLSWTNPTDSSGLKNVWYKMGSAPTSPTDGISNELPAFNPLAVVNGAGANQTVYVWLEDGAGHKDQTHFGTVVLVGNTTPNTPPTISAIGNQIFSGIDDLIVPFTVSDTETTAKSLTVVASSSNQSLVRNADILLGSYGGGNRVATIAHQTSVTGSSTITITVVDAGGLAASALFTVTVPNGAYFPAPELFTPSQYATGVSRTPTFSWNGVNGTDIVRIILATNPNDLPTDPNATTGGPSVAYITSFPSNTTTFTLPTTLSEGTTYYWTVNASTAAKKGYWAQPYSFTTLTAAGGPPTIDSLVATPSTVSQLGSFTLNAVGVHGGAYPVAYVAFVLDANDNGILDQSEWVYNTIGSSSGGANGFRLANVSGGLFSLGTHRFFARVKDQNDVFGTVVSTTVTIVEPVFTITVAQPSPSPHFVTSQSEIVVSGTIVDIPSSIQTITWTSDRGSSGQATPNASWTTPSIPLEYGTNVLTFVATDANGSICTTTYTVERVHTFVVSSSAVAVSEGRSGTFSLHLSSMPASDVTVSIIRSSGDVDITANVNTLVFTAATWNVDQTITLRDAEDDDAVNGTSFFTISAPGLQSIVTATEVDNDLVTTAFSQQLDFNNNLVPAGWTLGPRAGSPGRNVSVTNGRIEVLQQDTYAEFLHPIQVSQAIDSASMSLKMNLDANIFGMGASLQLRTDDGYSTIVSFNVIGQTLALRVYRESATGEDTSSMSQDYAAGYGTYQLSAVFRNSQIALDVLSLNTQSSLYSGEVNVSGLVVTNSNRFCIGAFNTIGVPQWVDDVDVSINVITFRNVKTWTNASGNSDWSVSGNWLPTGVPGLNDFIEIDNGTVNANSGFGSTTSIYLNGGNLNWSGGSLMGTLTIASGSVFSILGSNEHYFTGGTLNNYGTILWTGQGGLDENGGTNTVNNFAGGAFEIQSSPSIFRNSGGTFIFNNAGVFKKTISAGEIGIDATFNNSGQVINESGNLVFIWAGGQLGGTFTTSAGALTRFHGVYNHVNAATFSGPGTTRFEDTLTLNGDLFGDHIELAGLLNGNGTLYGSLTWADDAGGWLRGNLTVAAGAQLTLAGSSNKNFGGGNLINYGTINWAGPSWIVAYSGYPASSIINGPGGLMSVSGNATIEQLDASNLFTFSNAGTFRKAVGTGQTTIAVPFTNSGTVQIDSGSVSFAAGFSQSAGSVILNGGSISPSNFNISAGAFVANSDVAGMSLTLSGTATATFNSSQTIAALVLGSGTSATIGQNGDRVLEITSLTMAPSCQLDIADNAIIVRANGTLAGLVSKILTGQNGFDNTNGQANWNGYGIISSPARAMNLQRGVDVYGIGAIRNGDLDDLNGPGSRYTTWKGRTVGAEDVLIRFTYEGDANLDGTVTIDDYNLIDGSTLGLFPVSGWASGNFDYLNSSITIDDYNAIDIGYLFQAGSLGV